MLTKTQLINALSELKIGNRTNQQITQYKINVEFKRAGFSRFTYTIKDKLPDLSTSKQNFINRYIKEVIYAASSLVNSKAARSVADRETEDNE